MKAVLQRVRSASVHGEERCVAAMLMAVDGKLVSSIGPGILALVGVCNEDTADHSDLLTSKILSLRLWPDSQAQGASANDAEPRPWRTNVVDIGGEVLCGACSALCSSQQCRSSRYTPKQAKARNRISTARWGRRQRNHSMMSFLARCAPHTNLSA